MNASSRTGFVRIICAMDTAKRLLKPTAVCCALLIAALAAGQGAKSEKPPDKNAPEKPARTVYDYSLVGFDKKEVSLSTYKGKVLLIVNLASKSIFRDQISMLDGLQKAYKDQGLIVIGVPSNDFGDQEPGSEADIQKTYSSDMHLSFPVFARVSVRGKDQAPLYGYLTDKKGSTGGDVHWSYTKFIVDRTGKVVARFEPHIAPDSPELRVMIEDVLAGKNKPSAPKKDESKDASSDDEGGR